MRIINSASMNRRTVRRSKPSRLLALALILFCALLATEVCGSSRPAQANDGQAPKQDHSDNPAPQPKLRIEPQLVYVNAVVRDKKGNVVPTLKKEDFALDEDGRPQAISKFMRESDLPLTIGLLVDTSMSQRAVLTSERDASYTFLGQTLRADKDRAFLIHFDREVELLRDLTSDRAKLKSSLDELQIAGHDSASDDEDENPQRGKSRSVGRLYDAIYLASNELMKKQHGRKALFIFSNGVDRGSKESLEDAIEAAQRADTFVYSIYYASEQSKGQESHHGHWGGGMGGPGIGYPGGRYPGGGGGYPGGGRGQHTREARPDGQKVLARISMETGGRVLEISKKLTINDAYARVQQDLRNQYTLGYTPDREGARADAYHRIHLTTKQKDLTVQARNGYYSD
jgi:VWFA-related protein